MNLEAVTCKLSGLGGEKLHLIFNKKSSLVYHVEVFLFMQCKLCYNSISYTLSGLYPFLKAGPSYILTVINCLD